MTQLLYILVYGISNMITVHYNIHIIIIVIDITIEIQLAIIFGNLFSCFVTLKFKVLVCL